MRTCPHLKTASQNLMQNLISNKKCLECRSVARKWCLGRQLATARETDLGCFFSLQFSDHLSLLSNTSEWTTGGGRAWTSCCRGGGGALLCLGRSSWSYARFVLLSGQLFELRFQSQELLYSSVHLFFRGLVCLELPDQVSLSCNAGE